MPVAPCFVLFCFFSSKLVFIVSWGHIDKVTRHQGSDCFCVYLTCYLLKREAENPAQPITAAREESKDAFWGQTLRDSGRSAVSETAQPDPCGNSLLGGVPEDSDKNKRANTHAWCSVDISGLPHLNPVFSHLAMAVFLLLECSAMVFHKIM